MSDQEKQSGRPEQFKLVKAEDKVWVKERVPGQDRAVRHEVQVGPRGGQTFQGNDGAIRNAKAIPHVVQVHKEDVPNKAPKPGDAHYGNPKKNKNDQ